MAAPLNCSLSASTGRGCSTCRKTLLACLIVSISTIICATGKPLPGFPEDLAWITGANSEPETANSFAELPALYVPPTRLTSNHHIMALSNVGRNAAFNPYHQYFTVQRRAVWGKPQVRPLTGRELDPQTLLALESLSAANYDDMHHVNPNMFGEISRLVRDLASGNKHHPTSNSAAHAPAANGSAAPFSSLTSNSIHDHGAPESESGMMDFVGNNGMHALMPRIGKRNAALIAGGNLPRWLLASMDGDDSLAFGNEKFRAERSTNNVMGLAVPRVG